MSNETKPDLPMTTKDASNTGLDVVTDLALDATIPAPIRRNMFKAFDRLCSALIDVPVGALERRSAEKRAESEARIKIIRENADQIAQQMKVDPEYAQIAVNKYGQKILREQVNLDNISAIAANELKKTESDGSTNQGANQPNETQSADSTNQDTNGSEEKTIDDDWLNNFETQARQVSTEDMQLRFGRLLAGEIKKPGSYSIKTVKVFRELNRSAAVLFKRMCSMCMGFWDEPEPFRTVILPTACTDGRKGWRYSMEIWQLNILVEYGLITSRQEIWDPEYHSSIEKKNSQNCYPFCYQGRYWGLRRLPGSEEKNASMQVRGIPLSQTGRELFHIVEQEPMDSITEDFSKRHIEILQKFFAEHNLQMAEVQLQKKVFAEGKAVLYSVKWL
ncbi:MAG: DUF2806 domain-containing protein [Gammaproteobacteria bacterium]|nr:DUF2806 domain-containing protein [Gammaproteobacteria bacterium]